MMEPSQPQGANKITEAISQVEQGKEREAREAFDFLKAVPDSYSRAVEAFRPGLSSENSDVQIVCATAIGRFGRRVPWVIPEFSKLLRSPETKPFVRSAVAHSMGDLKSVEAAEALAAAIEEHLDVKSMTSFPFDAALNALARLGGIANNQRDVFQKACGFAEGISNRSLLAIISLQYNKFLSQVNEDFLSYAKDGPGKVFRELTAADSGAEQPLTLEKLARLGKWTLKVDDRFVIDSPPLPDLNSLPQEAQEFFSAGRLLEARIAVLTRRLGKTAVIACQDEFTVGSVINRIEDVAVFMSEKTGWDPRRVNWFTFSRGSGPDVLKGELSLVAVQYDSEGMPQNAAWTGEEAAQGILGRSFGDIRRYLVRHSFQPEDFPQYVMGLRHDQEIRERFEYERSTSPEGRVHYNDLPTPLGSQIKNVLAGVSPNIDDDPLGNEYSDSLDPDFPDVGIQTSIDYRLLEALNTGQEAGICLPLADDLLIEDRDSFGHPDGAELNANDLAGNLIQDAVVLIREVDPETGGWRLRTNVPRITHRGSIGYEWGYWGSGPRELALNILNHFVPPGSDGITEVEAEKIYWPPRVRTFSSATALILGPLFVEEVISNIPRAGGIISSDRIRDWILTRAEKCREKILSCRHL